MTKTISILICLVLAFGTVQAQELGDPPYEPTTQEKLDNAFPKFAWDRVPRTMLIRHGSAGYSDEEIERMARTYDIIVLEKANGGFHGYRLTASRLKAKNPDIKVLFYWNSRIYFGHQDIDDLIEEKWDAFIDPDFTIRDGLPTYKQDNPDLIAWWAGVCHKMMGVEEGNSVDGTPFIPSPIDGCFIDKKGLPLDMLIPLYEGATNAKFVMNNNGSDARERIAYLDGTYQEGWNGGMDPAMVEYAIALSQESGRNQKMTMLRNPVHNVYSARESEDRVDAELGIYLAYAAKYAYFYHQATVDATEPDWMWLTDYYDQFQRPLGAPLSDAVKVGYVYTRGFEHCDLYLDLDSHLGGVESRILWKNDVGNPALAGNGGAKNDNTYTLRGSGNISDVSDNFFFLSDLHYGNGSISAKIDSLENTDANARAGVMFRGRKEFSTVDEKIAAYANGEVLTASAKTVAVLRNPAGQIEMVYRTSQGSELASAGVANPDQGPYVKLVRNVDAISGYCSVDGVAWTELGQVSVSFGEKVEAGMAVCSGVNDALAEATFSAYARKEILPLAQAQSLTVAEDESVAITLSGSAGFGNNLEFRIISQPGNGTLSGKAPNLTYTPDENYSGDDVFSFRVNDGYADSEDGMVSVKVQAVNDAPEADENSVFTKKNVAVNIQLSGSDPENNALSYNIVDQPVNGALSGKAPNLTYTPANEFVGEDRFVFTVSDGMATSNSATITIVVASEDVGQMHYNFNTAAKVSGSEQDIVYTGPDLNSFAGVATSHLELEDGADDTYGRIVQSGGTTPEAWVCAFDEPAEIKVTLNIDDTHLVSFTNIRFDVAYWNDWGVVTTYDWRFRALLGTTTVLDTVSESFAHPGKFESSYFLLSEAGDIDLSRLAGLTDTTLTFIWEFTSSKGSPFNKRRMGLDNVLLMGTYSEASHVSVNDHHMPTQTFNAFPNPSKGMLTVSIKNSISNTIEIVDVYGKVIYKNAAVSDGENINLNAFPKGIYFLKFNGENLQKLVLK